MKTSIVKHEGEHGLFVNIQNLLDSMTEYDRRQIVAFACEDAVFIESVLRAIATPSQSSGIESTGEVDIWFSGSTKTKLRAAIMPLLGEAYATELTQAIDKAKLYEQCHRHLESLAHIDKLKREETDDRFRHERHLQWTREYNAAMTHFPQYQQAKVPA